MRKYLLCRNVDFSILKKVIFLQYKVHYWLEFTKFPFICLVFTQDCQVFIHYLSLTSPFTWLTPPGPYRVMTCRERELTENYIILSWPHKDMEGLTGWGVRATSETTRTWKTIHTIHAPIHSKKMKMKGWLWRSNFIRDLYGPKASWQLSYRWGKNPKHPGNFSRPGIEPGPAAWQACMLLHFPQRLTIAYIYIGRVIHSDTVYTLRQRL